MNKIPVGRNLDFIVYYNDKKLAGDGDLWYNGHIAVYLQNNMEVSSMKRKIIALCLIVAMLGVAVIGGTMAYFTDTAEAVNVMTIGSVKIRQDEKEWNKDRTALQDFTQAKPLVPYVGTLGWDSASLTATFNGSPEGAYRRFTMANVIDKYVTVTNTGKSGAYVRTFIALEMGDYSDLTAFAKSGISLSNNAENGTEFKFPGAWVWTQDFAAQIGGKWYNIMVAEHQAVLEPGKTTVPSLNQLYLSKDATNEMAAKLDGNGNGTYDILVFSEAVQASGFNSAREAFAAAFDNGVANYHPWGAVYDKVAEDGSKMEEVFAAAVPGDDGVVTIGISGEATWTTGAGIGSTAFDVPAGTEQIVINGLGGTFTAIGNGVGAIGHDNIPVVFKNLTIVDESVSYAENSWEYGYLEFRGDVTFENCVFESAVMMEGTKATFINCTFNATKDSEYAVWVSNGDASFTNCTFTGTRGLKTHEAYGSEVGTITVDGCSFTLSKKPGMAIGTVNADTTVTITNSTFKTQPGDQNLYIYETDTDVTTFQFTQSGNTVK